MLPALLKVEDSSRTSEARNVARKFARSLGFDEEGVERAAIVASEACTNLLKHAGHGILHLSVNPEDLSIELLALDRGPGMKNWRECVRDGFSTTGTAGTGLGAIERLSAFSDAYSQTGKGTVLYAVIAKTKGKRKSAPRISGVQAPKPGQDVCGDAWGFKPGIAGATLLVADGLGHGPDAAAASRCAMEIFQRHAIASPKDVLESVHRGLRSTRGAAVTVASMDEDRRLVVVAGLGNVTAFVCEKNGSRRQAVTMNGTAGVESRATFREFTYPGPEGSSVVLHSDGLTSHWDPSAYPALLCRAPGVIAGVLFRDFSRGNDDATVMVAV
jgi:anti-sigma regulatory factor (Ser/Thr protein kinase)